MTHRSRPECAASLAGIAAQLMRAMKGAQDDVRLSLKQAKRIHKALKEFERLERIHEGDDTCL